MRALGIGTTLTRPPHIAVMVSVRGRLWGQVFTKLSKDHEGPRSGVAEFVPQRFGRCLRDGTRMASGLLPPGRLDPGAQGAMRDDQGSAAAMRHGWSGGGEWPPPASG